MYIYKIDIDMMLFQEFIWSYVFQRKEECKLESESGVFYIRIFVIRKFSVEDV